MKSLSPEVEVTRLLSNNLYKKGFTILQDQKTRLIDTNELVARRIEELASKMKSPENTGFVEENQTEDGFVAGLAAEKVEGLLFDEEEQKKQAEDFLAAAKEEAKACKDRMLEEAREEIARQREQELQSAREQGYKEGTMQARQELEQKLEELNNQEKQLDEKAENLERQYDAMVDQLEPELVDAITGVYEYLFGVELSSYRTILLHLVGSTVRKIEGAREFLVHVSGEDYPYVSMEKKNLLSMLPSQNASLEIIEDITLKKNQCLIETEGGIFDCGLGTELAELTQRLKLLSYESKKDNA